MDAYFVLTDNDIQKLNEARIKKGWTRKYNSEALIEASLELIDVFIKQDEKPEVGFSSSKNDWECLKQWINEDKI